MLVGMECVGRVSASRKLSVTAEVVAGAEPLRVLNCSSIVAWCSYYGVFLISSIGGKQQKAGAIAMIQ